MRLMTICKALILHFGGITCILCICLLLPCPAHCDDKPDGDELQQASNCKKISQELLLLDTFDVLGLDNNEFKWLHFLHMSYYTNASKFMALV